MPDEKYKVARLIQASSSFSASDILEDSESLCNRDAVYAVIGELLDMGLVRDTEEHGIDGNNKVVKVYCVTHKFDENGKYKRNLEGSHEFDCYIEQLDYLRVKPGSCGKPRNLSFRIAEQLLNELNTSSENQTSEIKESSLFSIHRYLGLAQMEEKNNCDSGTAQAEISEAHIRILYAEYLVLQDSQQWSSAIAQLLKASRRFHDNNLFDVQKICESRACEVLIQQFTSLASISTEKPVNNLLEFAQEVDNLITAIVDKCRSVLFQFTCRQILEKVEYTVNLLKRSTGELMQVTSKGWTISGRCEDKILSPVYELLNQARCLLINSGRSQDNRMAAKKYLEEAQSILEISPHRNVKSIEEVLSDHLQAVTLSLELSEASGLELRQKIFHLNKLSFEGILPFYWADTLKQLISTATEMSSRIESSSALEKEIEYSLYHVSEPLSHSLKHEDLGYNSTDFDNLRSALKISHSNQVSKKQQQERFVGESRTNNHTLNFEYGQTNSKNISMEKDTEKVGINLRSNSSWSPLLKYNEETDVRQLRNTSSIEQYTSITVGEINQSYTNGFEFDFIKKISLPKADQIILSESI